MISGTTTLIAHLGARPHQRLSVIDAVVISPGCAGEIVDHVDQFFVDEDALGLCRVSVDTCVSVQRPS